MLPDASIRRLATQIAQIDNADVRNAYLRFAFSLNGQRGLALQPDSHGYIESELRFYAGTEWYLSAVLNKQWVLFYFRNPAIRDGFLDGSEISRAFTDAELTKAKDYKLRLADLPEASKVCAFILQ